MTCYQLSKVSKKWTLVDRLELRDVEDGVDVETPGKMQGHSCLVDDLGYVE